MVEKTIAMTEVLAWLPRVDPAEAEGMLVGCELDDGESEESVPITGLAWGPGGAPLALLLAGGGRKLFRQVAAGGIVDGRPATPLAAAIADARTPAEVAGRAERREFLRAGVNPERLGGGSAAQQAVLALCRAITADCLPSAEVRHAAYMALRAGEDPETCRTGARLFSQVFALCRTAGTAVPEDCHWRLAWFLRHAGDLREAIAVSDVLESDVLSDPVARTLLATTRVASLLQLWRVNGEADLVRRADRAFKIAAGLSREDEALQALRPALNRALEQTGLPRT